MRRRDWLKLVGGVIIYTIILSNPSLRVCFLPAFGFHGWHLVFVLFVPQWQCISYFVLYIVFPLVDLTTGAVNLFIVRPPLYRNWSLSIDNSVRRLLLPKSLQYSFLDHTIEGLLADSAVRGNFLVDIWLLH